VIVTLLALSSAPRPAHARDEVSGHAFDEAVTAGVREHQAALQAIAAASGGHRASGTPGYDASAQYVFDRARTAGYDVRFQEFTVELTGDRTPPVLERISPEPRVFVAGLDFVTFTYSGSGDVTAEVVAVNLTVPSPEPSASTSGCEAADFAGFPSGRIALVQRGTCLFRVKADHALAAGAAGMILFNEGNPGRTGVLSSTLESPFSLPAVGTTFELGDVLRNGVPHGPTGVVVRLRTDTFVEERSTRNVIAETRDGDPGRVVVVGAHLDSVSTGPGINDNGSGSGSAAILEVAEVYAAQHRRPRNKLRFIWFAAEEIGLPGSTFHVDSLTPAERDDVLVMLNFDMVGSPNFARFVYHAESAPPGSELVGRVFVDYFGARGLPTRLIEVSGLTDHTPFSDAGIPVGGLFTGADGVKTPEEAAIFGGTAGELYDPCYHLACDTLDNTSLVVLEEMSRGIAHAVLVFSKTALDLRGAARDGAADVRRR
jgi:Zn-dependent M28 family amino/carboxypeptidase